LLWRAGAAARGGSARRRALTRGDLFSGSGPAVARRGRRSGGASSWSLETTFWTVLWGARVTGAAQQAEELERPLIKLGDRH